MRNKAADISFGNLLLRIFGKGKLAQTHISIKSISKHLEKYEWKLLKENNKENNDVIDRALMTLQKIAIKNFRRDHHNDVNNTSKLLLKIADLTQTSHGRFYLTPSTTARDLYQQIPPWMKLIHGNKKGKKTSIEPAELLNSKEAVDSIRIVKAHGGIYIGHYYSMALIDLMPLGSKSLIGDSYY